MKVNLINSHITKLVVHIVGNKIADDGFVLSKSCLPLSNDLIDLLNNYFLGSFISDEYYHLYHDSSLKLNEVFSYASEIFESSNSFYAQSVNLAKHLYNKSIHPNIKAGEFYIAFFEGIIFDGKEIDALGLFKTEKKNIFLKTLVQDGNVSLKKDEGIDVKKLNKGCLIFNTEKDKGYVVVIIDNTNKGVQAKYWIDDFLHACTIRDTYTNTENMMSLTKSFVTRVLSKSNEISKADQISFLDKSLQYFQQNKSFNINGFEHEVIAHPKIIERFRNYKGEYESSRNISIDDDFKLSEAAIKKQQRSYKRAISLDKKIQIIINGNSDRIEKGKDTKGNFYKIYYIDEE